MNCAHWGGSGRPRYLKGLAEKVNQCMWDQRPSPYGSGFQGFCALAKDLLADDELGFESLADVSYFLQQLAAGRISWQLDENVPARFRLQLEDVYLQPERVDSRLVIRSNVLEQATAALNAGKHLILTGPPGAGKTTLAEEICRHAHDLGCTRGHVLATATADWTTFDTIGGYMPTTKGDLVFRPGTFLNAIRAEKWLIIDEINRGRY